MALKTLLMRKRIDNKKKELEALRAKAAEFETREAELEQAINEVETDEQRTAMEEEVNTFNSEKAEHENAVSNLEREVEQLENDLAAEEAAQETDPPAEKQPEERKDEKTMKTAENVRANLAELVTRDNVQTFLGEVRTAISEKRSITGAGLLIPDVMLDLIREEVAKESRLLPFVYRRPVSGTARQNITGAIPEAVWTEMCANLNDLALTFNQVEVDGYKVGGYVAVCNALLEDSDIALANEIITAIGGAIGKALDNAILFGTGTKMPTGIVTRLAQTEQPSDWGSNAPAWVDLHTSNILKLNINSIRGAEFFEALIGALGVAKPVYSSNGLFWVMNRKTHLAIMAKALAFNSDAALVANTTLMPIIGGTVVEFENDRIADNEIIGGFGGNYLLAERQGVTLGSSDIPLFLQDQTVFKGTARYDGLPVAGKAFVVVNFNNTNPTTSRTFPTDYANADMNALAITAAAGSAIGDTVLTVAGTIAQSNPVLKYKVGSYAFKVGDTVTGFTDLTSGTTQITAAAGKPITVVELDAAGKVVSTGVVASIPKA